MWRFYLYWFILQFFYEHGLTRSVFAPTRDANILDLILSNDPNCFFNVTVGSPFSSSDHCIVSFDIVLLKDFSADHSVIVHGFSKADWDGLITHLSSVDFTFLEADYIDIASKCELFYDAIYHSVDIFVPTKVVNTLSGYK